MPLDTFFAFLGKMGILLLGVFIIAVLTPRIAAWIDKKRAENPSPYGDEPSPARVDDNNLPDVPAEDGKDGNPDNTNNS